MELDDPKQASLSVNSWKGKGFYLELPLALWVRCPQGRESTPGDTGTVLAAEPGPGGTRQFAVSPVFVTLSSAAASGRGAGVPELELRGSCSILPALTRHIQFGLFLEGTVFQGKKKTLYHKKIRQEQMESCRGHPETLPLTSRSRARAKSAAPVCV